MAETGKTQKIRLYHLAKELGIPTQDILSLCKEAGLDVKTHASTLDEEMAKKIKKVWVLLKSGKVEKIYRNTQEGVAEAVVSKPADAKAKTTPAHPVKTPVAAVPVKPVHPKPVAAKPAIEKPAAVKPVHEKPHAPAVTHAGTTAAPKPAALHPVKPSAPVPAKPVLTPKPTTPPTVRPAAPKPPVHISPYKPGQTNKPSYQAAPPPPRPNRPDFGRPRPNTPRPGQPGRPDGSRPGQPGRPDFSRPGQPPRPDGSRPGGPNRPDFSRPGQPPRPDGSRPGGPNRPDFSRPGQPPRTDGQRPGQPGRPDNSRPGQGQPFRPGQRPGSSTMYQGRPSTSGQRPAGPGGHQAKTTVVFPRQKPGIAPTKRQRDQDTLTQSIFPVTDAVPIVADATKRKKDIGREREKQRERALDKWVVEEENKTAAGKHKLTQRDSNYVPTPGEEEKSNEPIKIQIAGVPTVQVLAQKLNIKPAELLKKAFISHGKALTINSRLDEEVIFMLAADYDAEVEFVTQTQDEELLTANVSDEDKNYSEPRGPVVTIMGHVDHGKTSLLDAIRHTNVTAGEFGGITQHIGAYDVKVNDRSVVFLDTPGHEAFTAMRARGAKVTDIVVLVVSAVDGMMPQTVEAIHHAQAANVPILVAINKIDLPESRPDRIKQQLSEHNLVPEDWGGKTVYAEVSAKKKIGLEHLLEMLLLQADIMELKCNPKLPVSGTVIEAKLDKGRGPVATVLIDQGTLKAGDPFVAGVTHGKVRAMLNDKGEPMKKVGPAKAVEVLGFSSVPDAGDKFIVLQNEKVARDVAYKRQIQKREEELITRRHISLDDLSTKIAAGEVKELRIIIKGDVQGSIEALAESLQKLSTDKVKLLVIHSGVGAITESDILLASASDAIAIGFNIRPEPNATELAKLEGVDVRSYRIIYDAVNEIRDAMAGLLSPTFKEVVLGRVAVRQLYQLSKVGTIAGCYVQSGKITRSAKIRLLRDNKVVWEGSLGSLKRFKDDAKEVLEGFECGLTIDNYNDLKEGDIIEAYMMEEVAGQL